MIVEYHRPNTQDEAIVLLSRDDPPTIVIGGGLYINEVIEDPIAVVDLQNLDLAGINQKGNQIQIGASAKLQSMLDDEVIPQVIKEAIRQQENYNRRQVATIAGSLVAGDGRSAILCVILAMDAEVSLQGKNKKPEKITLGDLIPLKDEILIGKLISGISISSEVVTAYHYVARSPADLPIVAAAVAKWPSGRTRVVLAGFGDLPRMVFDGPDDQGAEIAARDAYSEANDHWASAAYRSETAGILVTRCLSDITK